MIQPHILILHKPPTARYFLEYNDRAQNNSMHAYLFPCTEEGTPLYDEMSKDALRLLHTIQMYPKDYQHTGIITLTRPSQPLVIACSCHETIWFNNPNEDTRTCHCGRTWHRDEAIALPQAHHINGQNAPNH